MFDTNEQNHQPLANSSISAFGYDRKFLKFSMNKVCIQYCTIRGIQRYTIKSMLTNFLFTLKRSKEERFSARSDLAVGL